MVMLIVVRRPPGVPGSLPGPRAFGGFPPGARAFLTLGALAAVTLGAVTLGALGAVAAEAEMQAAGSDTLLQFLQFQI